LGGRKRAERVEKGSDDTLEKHTVLATDAAAGMIQEAVGHMAVGTVAEVVEHHTIVGTAAAEAEEHHTTVGTAAEEEQHHTTVDTAAEEEKHHTTVGTAAEAEKHHMVAGIAAEAEVHHMAVDTTAVAAPSHTPASHLASGRILVLTEENRMQTDHPLAAHPSLASPAVHNPVAARSSAAVDTNLARPTERACQGAVETPRRP